MTATTQTKEIISRLESAGFNHLNFSVKANRRRVRGEDGKKHTEFLPGFQITLHDNDQFIRSRYEALLAAGFDLIFTYNFKATGDRVSLIPARLEPDYILGQGSIYFTPLELSTEDLEDGAAAYFSRRYRITARDFNESNIVSVTGTITEAGKLIFEQLTQNPSRIPYLHSWLQSNCQIILERID